MLFLCVANSARSQMAEGLAKEILGSQYEVQSAGSEPASSVNPMALKVLAEEGIDISQHRPKHWKDLPRVFLNTADFIITLCAEEACPIVPGAKAKKLSWAMPDPAGEKGSEADRMGAFRRARDEIKRRLEEFKRG